MGVAASEGDRKVIGHSYKPPASVRVPDDPVWLIEALGTALGQGVWHNGQFFADFISPLYALWRHERQRT